MYEYDRVNTVDVRPQGWTGAIADGIMWPFMKLLHGYPGERPQRTHFWNNQKFPQGSLNWLSGSKMVFGKADPQALPRSAIPWFHMPRFGTWQHCVIVCPAVPVKCWYVGWREPTIAGISRIPLYGEVKLLRGDADVWFFGVNERGIQIPIICLDQCTLGDKKWLQVPLR